MRNLVVIKDHIGSLPVVAHLPPLDNGSIPREGDDVWVGNADRLYGIKYVLWHWFGEDYGWVVEAGIEWPTRRNRKGAWVRATRKQLEREGWHCGALRDCGCLTPSLKEET